jgi:Endonuclease NucS C-terminal domain
MTTKIKAWQIINKELRPIETSLADSGRTEQLDLEAWIATDPSILGPDLVIIGRQVATKSGPLDLLAVDRFGNLVVVELKREKLPREALVQAIDYASDIAGWSVAKIGEVCAKYTGREFEDLFAEAFPDADLEGINLNGAQRILLVGFAVESSLERMISWLSSEYGVSVNAVVLHYTKTSSGDEVLTKTAVISEEIEQEHVKKRKVQFHMSDEPGTHDEEDLFRFLTNYLAHQDYPTINRMREIILPVLLKCDQMSRQELLQELVDRGAYDSIQSAGYAFTAISRLIGLASNDFLRQVIGYEYPNNPWEKDNYYIRPEQKELVAKVLDAVSKEKALE